uniref:Uncharacterized protein n=1 Tax=Canis lupus familiaris TaxID=9615 RepID=A0A8C0NFP1_CANLF
MGDVKLAALTQASKTSVSVDHSRAGSAPPTEAPAFILPPRNLCIREGATAKFEGRVRSVRSVAGGEVGEEMGQGRHHFPGPCPSRLELVKAWFSPHPHIK